MRTIDEIKKDQDQEIYNYGNLLLRAEMAKLRVITLAKEANEVQQNEKKEEPQKEKENEA